MLSQLSAHLGFTPLWKPRHAVRNAWGLRVSDAAPEIAASMDRQGIRLLHNELLTLDHAGGRYHHLPELDDLWKVGAVAGLAMAQLGCGLAPRPAGPITAGRFELIAASDCD